MCVCLSLSLSLALIAGKSKRRSVVFGQHLLAAKCELRTSAAMCQQRTGSVRTVSLCALFQKLNSKQTIGC